MTVSLTITDVSSAADRADLPYPDVYFTPHYGAAAAASEAGSWRLAHWEDRILLPYLLRSVDGVYSDLSSPIGYSGIYVHPDCSAAEVSRFWSLLVEHLRDLHVVSLFLRFSPLDQQSVRAVQGLDGLAIQLRHDTITVQVGKGTRHVWDDMAGRSRTAIRKAHNTGLEGIVRPAHADDLAVNSPFRRLYEATMRRVGCRPVYLFTDRYYELLLNGLGKDLALAQVRGPSGNVVATALFMRHGERVHYHLSGSDGHTVRDGANNLMLWTTFQWAHETGCSEVHLGGGVRADDALFTFKRSFGGLRTPFHTASMVLDPDQYIRLTADRAARLGVDVAELTGSGFFPAYRAGG